MKIIFVDFDDCIYLHKEHWEKEKDFKMQLDYGPLLNKKYDPDLLNKRLLDRLRSYLKYYEDNNIDMKIVMLTTCNISAYFDKKRDFINRYCSDIFDESYAVSDSDDKVKFIVMLMEKIGKPYEKVNITLIDDNIFTLAEAQKYGIEAYTPMYFSEIYEI